MGVLSLVWILANTVCCVTDVIFLFFDKSMFSVTGVIIFVIVARHKRATHGVYSPSGQEIAGTCLELGSVVKIPPLERLI